jgi:hypothetical protein
MAKRKDASNDRWIQRAIRNPGALRRTAKRMGLIKGDEKLSETDLNKLASRARKTGDTTLMRRVNLARTLRRLKG